MANKKAQFTEHLRVHLSKDLYDRASSLAIKAELRLSDWARQVIRIACEQEEKLQEKAD
ncbi:MAG: hypothetical protein FWF56_03650 [Firmicutes bacterium]|nr:hypothetical protein [Bacillota bacterium]